MIRIGIDIGGTFTDAVVLDEATGSTVWLKVPTNRSDPAAGVLDAIAATLVAPEAINAVRLGTTLGVNAILTRTGARTGLITTEGFRDVLEIRRTHRERLFDLNEQVPEPLVPRDLRVEVRERIGADGSIVTPLDPESVRLAWHQLRERDIEAVAIVFLFSFQNPVHEREARRILRAEPDAPAIYLSSDVLPAYREYERTSTTVAAAFVADAVGRHLDELATRLGERGVRPGALAVMTSAGGVMSPSAAAAAPMATLLSGPAGGVAGARALASALGLENVLTIDMGGTSCDVSSIVSGVADERLDVVVAGHTITYPSFDIETIGAGGGSIAWIDSGGALRVGPQSAGSEPGPASYGRGGVEPTVTDADLILGRYDVNVLLGEVVRLDRRLAEAAIRRVADPLGMSVEEAAAGIVRIVDAHMTNAVRTISVERGRDPRDFTLVSFGGAGPVHAAEIAAELGVPRVLVPPFAGCTSAFGALISDSRRDRLQTVARPVEELAADELTALLERLGEEATLALADEGYAEAEISSEPWLDLRYSGQAHELAVAAPDGDLAAAVRAFHALHEQLYGHAFDDVPVELVNARVKAFGRRPVPTMSWAFAPPSDLPLVPTRRVWFASEGFVKTDIRRRAKLTPGDVIVGPAVIHQVDTTVVVPPGCRSEVLADGSLLLHVARSATAGMVGAVATAGAAS